MGNWRNDICVTPKNVRNLHSTPSSFFLYVSYFDISLFFLSLSYYVGDRCTHVTVQIRVESDEEEKKKETDRRITLFDRLLIMHIINRTLFRLLSHEYALMNDRDTHSIFLFLLVKAKVFMSSNERD